jgi:hypothetical protein
LKYLAGEERLEPNRPFAVEREFSSMAIVVSYLKDLIIFFWPPLIFCAVIGAIASGKKRRLVGSFIGIVGGVALGFVLMLTGPPPGRP